MGSDESKPLNMNISELCKKEEQNLPLNIRFVGRGSYGVVYAYKHDPDYVYKMYNTEELYSYDYKAYERINKYINDKIPEYKDLFAEYCGSVEQKSFKYKHLKCIKMRRYKQDIFNPYWSASQIKNILNSLYRIFNLIITLNKNGILFYDLHFGNILYKISSNNKVELVLCDYADMIRMDTIGSRDTDEYCFHYAYSPIMYLSLARNDHDLKKLLSNDYNLSVYMDKFRKAKNELSIDTGYYNEMFFHFRKHMRSHNNYDNLFYEKFHTYEKFSNDSYIPPFNIIRKSLKDKYGDCVPTYKEYCLDVIQFFDIYCLGIIISGFSRFIPHNIVKAQYDTLTYKMMTVNKYFQKSFDDIQKEFAFIHDNMMSLDFDYHYNIDYSNIKMIKIRGLYMETVTNNSMSTDKIMIEKNENNKADEKEKEVKRPT
jgi:hypothetical protein|uniref:Protein kinase domain-containing protein n=1 Tax=viral metagenome TaxID=1070528 RepID=A0A6C0IKV7_9ZZZZ